MPALVRSRSTLDGAVANDVRGKAQLDKICWPATTLNFVEHKSLTLFEDGAIVQSDIKNDRS